MKKFPSLNASSLPECLLKQEATRGGPEASIFKELSDRKSACNHTNIRFSYFTSGIQRCYQNLEETHFTKKINFYGPCGMWICKKLKKFKWKAICCGKYEFCRYEMRDIYYEDIFVNRDAWVLNTTSHLWAVYQCLGPEKI